MQLIRQGIREGILLGGSQGLTGDFLPLLGGGVLLQVGTGMFALAGQSNMVSAGANAQGAGGGGTGVGTTRSADRGYNISLTTPFSAVTMNERYATAPTTPMNYFDTGTEALLPYSGSGGANMGPEQTIGRWLVNHNVYPNPALVKFAVSSTRLDVHWLSQFPSGTATTMYQDFIAQLKARRTELNRQYDGLVWIQGESDAGSASAANAYQANLGTFFTRVRTDLGLPNLPVFIQQLNRATSASTAVLRDTVRAAQAAYVLTDPNAVLVNVDDIFLESDPHYAMIGQADMGERNALAIRNFILPSASIEMGTGPTPYYQQAAAGCTTFSGGIAFPRSGPETRFGDREYLVCSTYPNTGTLPALTALTGTNEVSGSAGFTQVTASIVSGLVNGNSKTLTVWERIVGPSTPTGSSGRLATPAVMMTSGTANLNITRIFDIRGGTTGSTTNFVVAANNGTNSTTLVFPSVTSSVDNSLAVAFVASNGSTTGIASVTNGAFANISVKWDSIYNPGAGFVHMGMFTAQLPTAGAYGPTTVTLSASSNNVGFMSILPPGP